MMRVDWLKRLLVVPILSILTILILPLILYWSPRARAFCLYSQATSLENATTVLVVGRGKFNFYFLKTIAEKNFDICDFYDYTQRYLPLIDDPIKNSFYEKNGIRVSLFCLNLWNLDLHISLHQVHVDG